MSTFETFAAALAAPRPQLVVLVVLPARQLVQRHSWHQADHFLPIEHPVPVQELLAGHVVPEAAVRSARQ